MLKPAEKRPSVLKKTKAITKAPTKVVAQEKIVKKKSKPTLTKKVKTYCSKIDKKFLHWGWGLSQCKKTNWNHVRDSVWGDPLIWAIYGSEKEHKVTHKDTTMIFCGVHGDEITPIKFCFDIIRYLEEMDPAEFDNKLIVVAPVVSPDSFFKKRPTRTNARAVDINRNFPTKDWNKKAIKMWKTRYRSDKRRYPGKSSLSEPETLFQVNLIRRYGPDKIISIHAPLTLLDYDGPEDDVSIKKTGQGILASKLLSQMSQSASGYKIKNYPYFPGSLGNWAGKERNIPVYTLELPDSDNRKHKKYWELFQPAIEAAINKDLRHPKKIKKNKLVQRSF